MDYNLRLNAGEEYLLKETQFDAKAFTEMLNTQQNLFVNISGIIVTKHAIVGLFPVLNEVK